MVVISAGPALADINPARGLPLPARALELELLRLLRAVLLQQQAAPGAERAAPALAAPAHHLGAAKWPRATEGGIKG